MRTSLGFTTGIFHQTLGLYDAFDVLTKVPGIDSIELSCLREKELAGLLDFLIFFEPNNSPFRISIHLPKIKHFDPDIVLRSIDMVLSPKLGSSGVQLVFHPEDYPPEVINKYHTLSFCLENMDSSKSDARTVEEFEKVYNQYRDINVCIDIAHAKDVLRTNDKVLEFFSNDKPWADYIRYIHLSHLERGKHVPLRLTQFEDLRDVIAQIGECQRVPPRIILETPTDTAYMTDGLIRQISYIRNIQDGEADLDIDK